MEFRCEDDGGPLPTRLDRLETAERLLVLAFRRWIVGWTGGDLRQWERVWDDFSAALGAEAGRAALTAFSALMSGLRGGARRPIRHHQPCCPMLHADEVALLGLVAAAQHGGPDRAAGRASWLVRAAACAPVAGHAAELGARFAAADRLLPDRTRRAIPALAGAARQAVMKGGAGRRV